jgi:hypothetical protein
VCNFCGSAFSKTSFIFIIKKIKNQKIAFISKPHKLKRTIQSVDKNFPVADSGISKFDGWLLLQEKFMYNICMALRNGLDIRLLLDVRRIRDAKTEWMSLLLDVLRIHGVKTEWMSLLLDVRRIRGLKT